MNNVTVIVILLALIAFAGVATVRIGNSKQNREGNPDYDQKVGANTLRLTLFYGAATVLACLALVLYVTR
jgi:hypothetical protein